MATTESYMHANVGQARTLSATLSEVHCSLEEASEAGKGRVGKVYLGGSSSGNRSSSVVGARGQINKAALSWGLLKCTLRALPSNWSSEWHGMPVAPGSLQMLITKQQKISIERRAQSKLDWQNIGSSHRESPTHRLTAVHHKLQRTTALSTSQPMAIA